MSRNEDLYYECIIINSFAFKDQTTVYLNLVNAEDNDFISVSQSHYFWLFYSDFSDFSIPFLLQSINHIRKVFKRLEKAGNK